MARLNVLEEELPYPKKMWKGFQSKLLRRLRESKVIIKTTQQLLSNSLCRHHHHHHVYFHHCHQHDNEKLSPERGSVNDRYYVHKEVKAKAAPVTAPSPQQQQPPGTTMIERHDEDNWQDHGNGSHYDIDEDENDDYTLVGTPDSERMLLQDLNAKSEKFIRSFYERLKLERQTTIEEEFEEMLDHSI